MAQQIAYLKTNAGSAESVRFPVTTGERGLTRLHNPHDRTGTAFPLCALADGSPIGMVVGFTHRVAQQGWPSFR